MMDYAELLEAIRNKYLEIFDKLNSLPERSGREHQTSAFIKLVLRKNDIKFTNLKSMPGCFGTLRSPVKNTKTIAFRADIDALPIENGFKHACGHSAHSANLLITLIAIKKHNLKLMFNLRFVFQPAEETGEGALVTIKEQAYDGVDFAISMHNYTTKSGELLISYGQMMSGTYSCQLEIKGPGGHSSRAAILENPIAGFVEVSSQFSKVINNQKLGANNASYCFATLNSGSTRNILPDSLESTISIRYFKNEDKEYIFNTLVDAINKARLKFKTLKFNLKPEANEIPPLANNKNVLNFIKKAVKFDNLSLCETTNRYGKGSEDFAFVSRLVPSAQIYIGINNGKDMGISHTGSYRVDYGDHWNLHKVWLSLIYNYGKHKNKLKGCQWKI